MTRSSLKNWLLVFGCWTALVVTFTAHSYLYSASRGVPVNYKPVLLWGISEWYTWAALTPFVVWLARRYSIEGPARLRAILIHIAAAVGVSVLHVFLQSGIRYLALSEHFVPDSFSEVLSRAFAVTFHVDFTTYTVIVCCTYAIEYYSRYRLREMRSSQLEAALANAQLEALRMQINPHFLFNTLNSISALIDEDRKAAQRMLTRLGDFLRLTLKNPGSQASSLEQELQFLKSYLQIEQVRFGDRLKISIDVEPAALKAAVPSLILQPIVENAFHHAISKVDAGSLDIHGRRRGDELELTVLDNGPGVSTESMERSEGLGLANTRARLQTQYGSAQCLKLENGPGGGLLVTIRIPFVEATA